MVHEWKLHYINLGVSGMNEDKIFWAPPLDQQLRALEEEGWDIFSVHFNGESANVLMRKGSSNV